MKFGRIIPGVNAHRLTESDFRFDVIILRWRDDVISCGKVLLSGEWLAASAQRLCSIYASSQSIEHSYDNSYLIQHSGVKHIALVIGYCHPLKAEESVLSAPVISRTRMYINLHRKCVWTAIYRLSFNLRRRFFFVVFLVVRSWRHRFYEGHITT